MDQLIEGVLTVSAGLTPDDRASRKVNLFATLCHALAIALHVTLLEVSGETVQILIVRQQCVRLRTVEVGVPDAHQSQDNRGL